jgi:hypothetical protein
MIDPNSHYAEAIRFTHNNSASLRGGHVPINEELNSTVGAGGSFANGRATGRFGSNALPLQGSKSQSNLHSKNNSIYNLA